MKHKKKKTLFLPKKVRWYLGCVISAELENFAMSHQILSNPRQCVSQYACRHALRKAHDSSKLTIGQSALTMHRPILSPPPCVFILRFPHFVLFFLLIRLVPRYHLPFLHDCPVTRWHGPWPRMPITDIAREPIRSEIYLKINRFSDSLARDLYVTFHSKTNF